MPAAATSPVASTPVASSTGVACERVASGDDDARAERWRNRVNSEEPRV